MTAASRTLGILFVALTFAAPARGETIWLTSGAFDWTSPNVATVTMEGAGFSFDGIAYPSAGVFTPWYTCQGRPECSAGGTLDLYSRWTGRDIPGRATYNGTTYPGTGGIDATSGLDARWFGSLFIPTSFTGGLLTSPFQFAGEFYYQGSPTTMGGILNLRGSGTASLVFSPFPPDPSFFNLDSVRYEFDAAPVPEPASMLLIGTGLAGLAAMHRRRRQGIHG